MRKRPLAILAALLALGTGRALAEDPTARGFDPDTARLALSLEGGFAVETAGAATKGTRSLGVVIDYASGLLALKLGDERDELLASRLSLNILAGWSLGRVEIAANLPLAVLQSSDFSMLERQGVTGPLVSPIAPSALGDLRVGAKVPLLDASSFPIGVAAMVDARLPTGNGDAFYGDGFAVTPSIVLSRPLGRLRLDAQLGYLFRDVGQYAQLVVHDMLVYGAGATLKLPSLAALHRWVAIGEVVGGWPRGNDLQTQRYRSPLSARAGVRMFLSRALAVETGAGTGLGEAGFGRESWRVFVGARWTGVGAGNGDEDPDKDGIPNAKDQCPLDAGPAELDGCPDLDGDAIPDREDDCPREPGPAQNDGCPLKEEEPIVEIETERLSLKDAIHFDTAKDTIKSESFKILDEIARILVDHPELKKVRVEGHTDNVGGASYNKDLSQRRAASVVRYLSTKNLGDRLVPMGYGFERPIASNQTAGGRAKNRRVEFTILGEE